MPTHEICQNAKLALEQVRPLKKAFDDSFASAVSSGLADDVQLAQEYKQKFLNKMAEARTQIHALEKSFVQTHEHALVNSILRKKDTGEPLTKCELFALYGIHTSDPLSYSLLEFGRSRNHEEDLAFMFDAFSHELARSFEDIAPQTRIYVGSLDEPNFFQRIPKTLELIYTEFPEGRIDRHDLKIGGKTIEDLFIEMGSAGVHVDQSVKDLIQNEVFQKAIRVEDIGEPDWTQWELKPSEQITLIHLSVAELGLPRMATTKQIYDRAELLGLEPVPPETGLYYRLTTMNNNQSVPAYMGMKPWIDVDGVPHIFDLWLQIYHDEDGNLSDDSGPWLSAPSAFEETRWLKNRVFSFRFRRSE